MKVRCLGYLAVLGLGLTYGATAVGAEMIGFDHDHVRGEFFVKYKDVTPKMLGLKAGLQAVEVKTVDAEKGIVFVKLNPNKDGLEQMAQITELQADPNVE